MFKKTKFWSLIELTIILTVLSILCAILAPVINRYVGNAKVIRCREDVQAIGCSIAMFIEDTANSYFLKIGTSPRVGGTFPNQKHDNRYDMLVSDGDIPEVVSGLTTGALWQNPYNASSDPLVDFLENHLVSNTPGGASGNAYRTPLTMDWAFNGVVFCRDESAGFNSEFAWRGPYITAPIDPDPWGNRYAVNAKYLDPLADSSTRDTDPDYSSSDNGTCGYTYDVVVLSAGPDEEIDSEFEQDGLTPGDDDILYTVSANSRP